MHQKGLKLFERIRYIDPLKKEIQKIPSYKSAKNYRASPNNLKDSR